MRRHNANLRSIGFRTVEGLEVSRKPECSRARQETVQVLPTPLGTPNHWLDNDVSVPVQPGHCRGRQTRAGDGCAGPVVAAAAG